MKNKSFSYALRQTFKALLVGFVLAILSLNASAQNSTDGQTPLALAPGSPSGSYPLSDFENVNLFNGNLNFQMGLLSIGGRGGTGFPLTIHIDQKWTISKEVNPGHNAYYFGHSTWWSEDDGGNHTISAGRVRIRRGLYKWSGGVFKALTRITFTAPDGTEYELRDQLTGGQPVAPSGSSGFNRQKTFVTADGTAATFLSDSDVIDGFGYDDDAVYYPANGYMMLKDGTRFRIDDDKVSWMRDRNGNKVSFAYDFYKRVTGVTDSLNRQVTITYDNVSGAETYDQILFKGFGGASRTVKVGHGRATRSDLSTPSPLFPGLTGVDNSSPIEITYMELPDGRRYQFQYTPYAEIARIVLPTGGAIEYDWANGLTDGASSGLITVGLDKYVYRRVVERRVYPDGGTGTGFESRMTYSRPETTTTNSGYVLVNQYNSSGTLLGLSKHYFYGSPRDSFGLKATDYPAWQDSKEYKSETFDTNGATLLRKVENTFEQRAAVSWWTGGASTAPPNDVRPTETVSTLADTNQVSKHAFGYDDTVPFNNQNSVKEYDFGSGVAGVLLRETRTTFVTDSTYTVIGVHLRSLPSQVSIYDGNNTERARTTFEYDNYTGDQGALHAALVPRSSLIGFCDHSLVGSLITCPDDPNFADTSYVKRGNVTKVTKWVLPSTEIKAYSQYDVAGNVVKSIDARGNSTTIDYDDKFGAPDNEAQSNGGTTDLPAGKATFALPTKVTNAANQSAYAQFDYYLGKSVNSEDINGVVSAGYYNDPLDRPTQVIRAFNNTSTKNQTGFVYNDTSRTITVSSDQATYGDNLLQSKTYYDQMGRTFQTCQYEDGSACITVKTEFDALGRAYRTSSPYRGGDPILWTTSAFDALGRVTSVTTPDSAVVSTSYSGNTVTVTDQNSKARKSVTDGLGRLIQVYEDPSSLNYLTSYSYDTLDNLINVSQGGQTRTFAYDSLKRLTSATNPESGAISYQYDANGNLTQKTDARPVTATYAYDALNRATTRSYSDSTPAVTYSYDSTSITNGKGRLASVSSSVSTYSYGGYNAMGKAASATETLGSQNYSVGYTYDLVGHVTATTYPSGRTVNYSYDSAGRATTFGGNLGDGTTRSYSSEIIYSPMGGMTKEKFGTNTALYNKLFYNSRGQLAEIRESTSYTDATDTTWNRGAIINYYSNSCWGMCGGSTSTTSMTDNNGNLKKQETFIPNNEQNTSSTSWLQLYDYDALNRLQRVREYTGSTPLDWQQEYTYDRYGNRLINGGVDKTYGAGINNLQMSASLITNRMYAPGETDASHTQLDYDAAGNETKNLTAPVGAGTRVYDAENRMTIARDPSNNQIAAYTYDADGRRVKRNLTNQTPSVETWQVYGIGGELLAEYAANGSPLAPKKEYGYRNGQLLVTAEPGAGSSVPSVVNNGFEAPVVGGGNFQYGPTGGTSAFAGGTGVSGNGSAFTGANPPAPAGLQVAFVQGGNTSIISQSVSGFESGKSYSVQFKAAQRAGAGGQDFDVYLDTTLLGTFTPPSTSYTQMATAAFTTTAGAHTLKFVGRDTAGGDRTAFVDDVALTIAASTAAFVTGKTLAALRSDSPGWAGFEMTVAGQAVTVTSLGRYCAAGNSLTHELRVIRSSDNAMVASVNVSMSGCTAGQTKYATLATPVTLTANTTYRLVSYEVGGDNFHDWTGLTLTTTAVATVLHGVYTTDGGSTWGPAGGAGSSYVPVDFQYATSSSGTATVNWLVTDQLGTPRMIFDQTGSLATTKRHDYLPFGEELWNGARTSGMGYEVSNATRQKFTEKERDVETGLDYFNARYYSSTSGRFTSPDPLLSSGRSLQPQSWNRYAYVINRPLSLIDPSGLDWGVSGWDSDGQRTYRWFNGKIGKGYTAVKFDKSGSRTITATDGTQVKISNRGIIRQTVYAGPSGEGGSSSGHDALNLAAGHAHGIASALAGGSPVGQALVDAGFNQIGGVDRSSALYKNGNALGEGVTGGLLSLAAPGLAELGAAGQETTTLYRAVSEAEFEQLMETGTFQPGPNSLGGKWFAESAEHAEQWGRAMYEGTGGFRVIDMKIPAVQAARLMRIESLDGIGPARYAELEQLTNAVVGKSQ
ncbi:MAG TPA: RHS repeat-associated core domain-containing protein [Pyrinomonadaceae bacterium]|jgi:RHS repeat-associated protein|nr:RHS repeat-associated core domain-containing protein [Pyrinomonadaceae bacterium]